MTETKIEELRRENAHLKDQVSLLQRDNNALLERRRALSWQAMVHHFHYMMDLPIGDEISLQEKQMRGALVAEEADEFITALAEDDLVEAVDALADLIYVALGSAVTFGVDMVPIFAEVHQTNMAKVGGPVREDGKILKPEGWQPPRIRELLEEQNKAPLKVVG